MTSPPLEVEEDVIKKSPFSEEQIVQALKLEEASSVDEVFHKLQPGWRPELAPFPRTPRLRRQGSAAPMKFSFVGAPVVVA